MRPDDRDERRIAGRDRSLLLDSFPSEVEALECAVSHNLIALEMELIRVLPLGVLLPRGGGQRPGLN
jgi:hypothetical protein